MCHFVLFTIINVKFPNRLSIDSILLKDRQSDTLISIPRISASFELIPFIKKGDIRINTLLLSQPDVRLWRESPDSAMNIQFVVDLLSGKDSTESTPLPYIRINQVQIHDGCLSYDIHSSPVTERFDASHISVDNLQMNVALRTLTSDTLSLNLRRLSFDEQSGLSLKRAKARIEASDEKALIQNLLIRFAEGEIRSDKLTLLFNGASGNNVQYSGTLTGNDICPKEFAPLLPQFAHIRESFRFNMTIDGTEKRADIKNLTLAANDNLLDLRLKGNIHALANNSCKYSVVLSPLHISPQIARSIYAAATDGKEIPTEITRLGNTSITATVEGEGRQATCQAELNSEAGNIATTVDINKAGEYKATLTATEINIGRITDNPDWGMGGLSTTIEGQMQDTLRHTGNFYTTITPLQYKSYSYAPIRIQGNYTKESLETLLALNDKNLQVRMAFEYEANRETPRCELNMRIDSFSPNRLGLTEKHESSEFGFNIASEMFGNDIENARLNLNIYDFTLTTPEKEHKIRKFHLTAGQYDNERDLIIDSDFINGSLKGRYDYKTLAASYKRALSRIMPSLFPREEQQPSNNNFVFHFNIKDTETLTKIFDLPVTIKNPSMLQGDCNDAYNSMGLSAILNEVKYGDKEYRYVDFASNIEEGAAKNKLKLIRRPHIEDPEDERVNPDDETTIEIENTIQNDTARTNIKWKNLYAPVNNADIDIDLALGRDEQNELKFEAKLHETEITQSDTVWRLSPATISGKSNHITIDNFNLESGHQYAYINGKIGKTPDDTINADLRHLDIEYVFDMIDFHPVNIGGEVTGNIKANSLLGSPRFNSNLNIKGLTFEKGLIGDLALKGYWDEEEEAIILKGDAREGNESRTIVDGLISPARDTLNICIEAQKTRIDFLNHLLSSFISEANGRVSGKLYILGAMRDVNMQGALAPLGSIKIKPTNTTYNLLGDTLLFTRNKIGFDNYHIADNKGNGGNCIVALYLIK